MVVATGLLAILGTMAVPVFGGLHEQWLVRTAARYVAARLQNARLEALRRDTAVALRIDPSPPHTLRLFADGDGDGVSEADIADGVDVALDEGDRLGEHFASIAFRVSARVPDIGGQSLLEAGSDAIRIGSTALVSFSPVGSCTSGTLFVAAVQGPQAAVRLLGQTGRVRVLWFDAANGQWRPG